MKKISTVALGLLSIVITIGCKQAKKGSLDNEIMDETPVFNIVEDSTTVHFIAYKTTEKLPVGGDFLKADLTYEPGKSPKDVVNGLEFSIPVSSLFTNDATKTRDPKILEFFFGAMADTQTVKGKFKMDEGNRCTVSLRLNGVTADLPMTYSLEGDKMDFTGTLDLKAWNALEALASLNKVCKELHTGPDGVSKTWEDVAINASLLFQEK